MTAPVKKTPLTLACNVAAAVAAVLAAANVQAAETDAPAETTLAEVIVTATRRAENLQSVPIAVEALSEEKLKELGIDSFDDYVSHLPGVSGDGQGPGKKDIYIRGITSGRTAVRLAGIGLESGVATYLDEAPTSTAGRNIDLYATDLQRIEVLKGPQGTLFGSSSQAGTLRLITNKPQMNEFHAGGVLGASITRSGRTSDKLEGYVNIPAIEDKLAVRLAAYSSTEGGYIDNVFATISLPVSHPGLGGVVPSRIAEANNAEFIEDNYNDATYRGVRFSALWHINDDWDLLVQHTNQTLDTTGEFEYDPSVSTDGDLSVTTFSPNEADDRVDLSQWTLNGMIAGLEVIYNGSYTDRTFEGKTDYTHYIELGPSAAYYTCAPGFDECFSPVSTTLEHSQSDRIVQELRVATNSENRLRAIAGVYYDDNKLNFLTDFFWLGSIDAGIKPNFSIPGAFTNTNGVARPLGTVFFNDFQADREETSFFGELTYDITDSLTASFGARHYSIDIGLKGSSNFGEIGPGPDNGNGNNVDARLAGITPANLSDTIFKANLAWQVSENALVYSTFSQGFRSGGFNRAAGRGADPVTGEGGIPATFDTDDVDSYELGWKITWLDNTLRLNGAIYHVDFDNQQQGVLDFSITNTTFFDNVGDADIDGGELQLEWKATENLNLFGSFAYIDSEITSLPVTLINIAPVGSDLPLSPKTAGEVGARYQTDIGGYSVFAQGIFQWTDKRFSSLVINNRVVLPSYEQFDLSAGIGTDQWRATLFVDNVFDTLGQLSAASEESVLRFVPTRPRTVGFRLSYDY
jgi:outer membrane receptor protein involved in Fe transport